MLKITEAERAKITAGAICSIIHQLDLFLTPRTFNEVWSEVASANTYGGSDREFVAFIREVERDENRAEYWYKRVWTIAFREGD